jgi:uncharacterized protein YjiS (DUF1127 family)
MHEKAWFARSSPADLLKGSGAAFHDFWSLSMPTLLIWPAGRGSALHQKNWRLAILTGWRRWRLRWARHRQRTVLRDLVDDPHLLEDIGVTREEALKEADRLVWDITDIHIPFV